MNLEIESTGGLLEAGLVASQIEGEGDAGQGAHAGNCANCQAPLTGSFCHMCGQRAHIHRSLLHLGEELLHGILHFDAKAWRTLPMLVARPGQLTRRYVDGQRTRFVSPLALFLFMVFFMFFVVSSISHSDSVPDADTAVGVSTARTRLADKIAKFRDKLSSAEEKLAAAKEEDKAEAQAVVTKAQATLDGLKSSVAVLDAAQGSTSAKEVATALIKGEKSSTETLKVDTGNADIDEAIRHAVKNPELTLYKLKNTASKYSFLLVPISLPFLWLMFFWKRGITMYDHAVFSLYSLAFMSFLVVVIALLGVAGWKTPMGLLIVFAPPVHMFMQLRGTYGLGVMSACWRTVALLFVAMTVFILYLLLILVLSMR
ncbi:MAG: DUF3667 domain-containing protein [Pseudomonadota bacterium]